MRPLRNSSSNNQFSEKYGRLNRRRSRKGKMRIPIREQLALLVIFSSLICLAVVSVAVWINNYNFVIDITSQDLSLTASLKAGQIAANLVLLSSLCDTITTRILIQKAVLNFYAGNTTADNWSAAANDIQYALAAPGSSSSLLQVTLFSKNATGNPYGLLNVTADNAGDILLPYRDNNQPVYLGDPGEGYPPALYPNLTYVETNQTDPFDPTTNLTLVYGLSTKPYNYTSSIFLGPLIINSTFALVSVTLPVVNGTNAFDVIGFMTVVAEATTLLSVISSQEGLDATGQTLIIGADQPQNKFKAPYHSSNATYTTNKTMLGEAEAHFIFPLQPPADGTNRHTENLQSFQLKDYPIALNTFADRNSAVNNASALMSTHNEQGVSVSVGSARPQTSLVSWVLVVEKSHSEAWQPIVELQHILLACVFGTVGVILLLVVPAAHYSVRPIRELRDATEKTIQPPGYTDMESIEMETRSSPTILERFSRWRHGPRQPSAAPAEGERFKIPGKVRERKHLVTDELTELTSTFNEMSDELLMQYSRLEERVRERTQDLEVAKKAAEAANKSKTLFIANISHELKTPLNGILGMCAVCLAEDDLPKIKRSLQVVYKSGDLLLHLLNDLLTFSKNQIGETLTLEEKDFRLEDMRAQILTIFDKQVKEGKINFAVKFIDDENWQGRLTDMTLWGDQHRILQVIINLVSNSLKFTPEGGRVEVRIRCMGEVEQINSTTTSLFSKQGSRRGRGRNRASASTSSVGSRINAMGTAVYINPVEVKGPSNALVRERTPTPPPTNARTFDFEFEVEDTGPGISEALQEKVFEPFVQGDLGLSKKYGGTGLGLSICSQLATLMGGTIDLESTIGVGTTFRMAIPLKLVAERAATDSQPPSRSTSEPPEEIHSPFQSELPRLVGLSQPYFPAQSSDGPSDDNKLRVLVAEDNPVNQEVVLRMLKLEDISDVQVAKDGQEAYDMVKASMNNGGSYDLIFMDIQMPNLDGLQSTRLIREMGYSAPIVALTAFSEESNVTECMKSGMNMFLSKPIRRPALKQVLKKFATIPEESELGKTTSEA